MWCITCVIGAFRCMVHVFPFVISLVHPRYLFQLATDVGVITSLFAFGKPQLFIFLVVMGLRFGASPLSFKFKLLQNIFCHIFEVSRLLYIL